MVIESLSRNPSSIIFVDSQLADPYLLATGLNAEHVVVLNDNTDAVKQITQALSQVQDLDSIHLFSHGDDAALQLGHTLLTPQSLSDHQSALSQWGKALNSSGDILLYGCNVAASPDGAALLEQLGQLTHADIAASNNISGQDGDWVLEVTYGSIETTPLQPDGYQSNLALKRIVKPVVPYEKFELPQQIALSTADANWDYAFGDYNGDGQADLFAIHTQAETGVELHVLDGANHFQSFLLQTSIALEKANYWDFELGDYNGDGQLDLFGIKKQGQSNTEIHILDGANRYQNFLLQESTALHKTQESWDFELGDYDRDGRLDIFAITPTGASGVEVHVLDGANRYRRFLAHSETALDVSDQSWDFELGDYNGDGFLDVFAVQLASAQDFAAQDSGSKDLADQGNVATQAQLQILDGQQGFQQFVLQDMNSQDVNSALPSSQKDWDFELGHDGRTPDIVGINRQLNSSPGLHWLRYNARQDRWSDPAIWGGTLPNANDDVVIDASFNVLLDTSVEVKSLQVDGSLLVEDRVDLELTTDWFMVNDGKFQVGTEANPFTNNFTLTLEGDDSELAIERLGLMNNNAFLMARGSNAVIEMHGASRHKISWTQLGATLEPGSRQITLKQAVNWEVGDKIAIASTDFEMEQAEEFSIIGISSDRKTLTLDQSVQYMHFGELQWYNNGRHNPNDLPLSYIASYGDLTDVFGADTEAGVQHFSTYGEREGRQVLFDGQQYLRQNLDLIHAGFTRSEEAAQHYINYGRQEGRPLPYLETDKSVEDSGSVEGRYNEWVLDERAEVGLLNRNLKIQGDADSAQDGYGGHMMIMAGAEARIEGVEFTRMGQKSRKGRYPFHWHRLGDATGQYFQNNSVHHTFNRAVTIHGTDNTIVRNNVAYDHLGHGYFLEDGAERGNLLEGNLGLLTRRMTVEEATIPTDHTHVSTYWLSNPDNTFRNNVAAGSDHGGFWFALPKQPTGESSALKDIKPIRTPLREFVGNVGHSNQFSNLAFDGSPDPETLVLEDRRYQPRDENGNNPVPVIRDFTGYKSRDRNLWMRSESMRLVDIKAADNGRATFFAFNQVLEDSLIVGRSRNVGTPQTPQELAEGRTLPQKLPDVPGFSGHNIYDGPTETINVHFAGFTHQDAAFRTFGAAQKSPVHSARGITFGADIAEANKVDFSPSAFRGYMWSSGLIDRDGSITGKPNSRIMPLIPTDNPENLPNGVFSSGFNRSVNSEVRPEWGAVINQEAHFGLLRVNPSWDAGSAEVIQLTRSDGQTVTDVGTYNWYYQNPVIVNQNYVYRLDFPKIPNEFELELLFVDHDDWVIVHIPNVPRNISVKDAVKVRSFETLYGRQRDTYFLDGDQLYVRLQGKEAGPDPQYGSNFTARADAMVRIPWTNSEGRSDPA